MRTAQEIAGELEALSNEYALMFEGVERDGQIDEEEAQLGQEYAEEYRRRLLQLREEIRENMRAVREQSRYETYLLKATGEGTRSELDVQYRTLRQQETDALAPFQALLVPLERALNEARLSRAAFIEVRDTLRADPGAYVAAVGLPTESLNLTMADELGLLLGALRRVRGDWETVLSEAEGRLEQPDYAPFASHLRGIHKGLQRAVDDVGAMLDLADEMLADRTNAQ